MRPWKLYKWTFPICAPCGPPNVRELCPKVLWKFQLFHFQRKRTRRSLPGNHGVPGCILDGEQPGMPKMVAFRWVCKEYTLAWFVKFGGQRFPSIFELVPCTKTDGISLFFMSHRFFLIGNLGELLRLLSAGWGIKIRAFLYRETSQNGFQWTLGGKFPRGFWTGERWKRIQSEK